MSSKVKGTSLPAAVNSTVEFEIADAEFKIIKIRPATTPTQTPIATLIVANPADAKQVLYGDLFLNGLNNQQAQSTIGNLYKGDVEIGIAVPVVDKETKLPITTQAGQPVVSRRARLACAPTLLKQAPDYSRALAV